MSRPSSTTVDREMVLTRILDAPRETVFRAWTEPERVAKWWGPDGFTTTIHAMDVRPGGVWRFIMHGPDGTDYDNEITYREVTPPERLVYDHGDVDGPIHFAVTVTFDDRDGRCELTMRSVFDTAEELQHVIREHGAAEGAEQHLARLAEHLATN